MATLVRLRELTAEERTELERLARSGTAEARLVVRARIVLGLADGERPYQVAGRVGVSRMAAYEWLRRFNAEGLTGLTDHPRPGRDEAPDGEKGHREVSAIRSIDWSARSNMILRGVAIRWGRGCRRCTRTDVPPTVRPR